MSANEATRACHFTTLLASVACLRTCHHEVGEVAHYADDKAGQELGDCMGHDES